jgi:glutathione S-transferase
VIAKKSYSGNEYTYYYFNMMARGEPTRMMLKHAQVPFEDVRYEFSEWPAKKATFPGGALPCLKLKDGRCMGESYAIARMLGKIHGYYPTDVSEAYENDRLMDYYLSIYPVAYKPFSMKDGPEKDEVIESNFTKLLPNFYREIEKVLSHGKKFLVCDRLCVVDFWIGGLYTNQITNPNISFAKDRWQESVKDFPVFKAYGERFAKENQAWLDTRP